MNWAFTDKVRYAGDDCKIKWFYNRLFPNGKIPCIMNQDRYGNGAVITRIRRMASWEM